MFKGHLVGHTQILIKTKANNGKENALNPTRQCICTDLGPFADPGFGIWWPHGLFKSFTIISWQNYTIVHRKEQIKRDNTDGRLTHHWGWRENAAATWCIIEPTWTPAHLSVCMLYLPASCIQPHYSSTCCACQSLSVCSTRILYSFVPHYQH